jgi:hypothetical protein
VPAIPWDPAVIQNLVFSVIEATRFHWSFVTMREVSIFRFLDIAGFAIQREEGELT